MKINRVIFAIILIIAMALPCYAWNPFVSPPMGMGAEWHDIGSKPEITIGDTGYGATFAEAVTAIGDTPATLIVSSGTWVAPTDPIPETLTLRVLQGSTITVADETTFTINGNFEAGLYQIFSCTGTGKVDFSTSKVDFVRPEWWGASPDFSTDCTNAIQAAIDSLPVGVVRFGVGIYGISSPLTFKASLVGALTTIKALPSWAGTMMVDFYSTGIRLPWMRIDDIIFDGNHLAVNIFGSSSDGEGNSGAKLNRLQFYGSTGYAVTASSASPVPGAFTGTTWDGCYFASCGGIFNFGNNQDDIHLLNCRVDARGSAAGVTPFITGGTNFCWDGGFVYFLNLPLSGSIKAIFNMQGRVADIKNIFFETNGSDITHFFFFPSSNIQVTLSNLFLRVNESGQSPNLIALIRANVNAWASARYPRVALTNILADYDAPTWKLLDLFVGSTANTDYIALDMTNISWSTPLFQWAIGSSIVTRPTVYIRGQNRGVSYNDWYVQGLGNTISNKCELPGVKSPVTIASAASPADATLTLPSEGIYYVTVTAKVGGSKNDMANGTWLVYFYHNARDTLSSQQLGTTTLASGGLATGLTLSAPSTAGVLTASATWATGNYACVFIFNYFRVSNFTYHCCPVEITWDSK